MREGGDAFARAAEALAALAAGDAARYRGAVAAIVRRLRGPRRPPHRASRWPTPRMLMEALAAPRGMAAAPASPLMPARGARVQAQSAAR